MNCRSFAQTTGPRVNIQLPRKPGSGSGSALAPAPGSALHSRPLSLTHVLIRSLSLSLSSFFATPRVRCRLAPRASCRAGEKGFVRVWGMGVKTYQRQNLLLRNGFLRLPDDRQAQHSGDALVELLGAAQAGWWRWWEGQREWAWGKWWAQRARCGDRRGCARVYGSIHCAWRETY